MRRVRPALLCALLALPVAGCLESHDHVSLGKDGQGTIVSRYAVDLKKADELVQTARMLFGSGGGQEAPKAEDGPDPLAPVWFQEAAKSSEGYTVKEIGQTKADGNRTTNVTAAFTSLEAAARGGAFFSSTVTLSKVEPSEESEAAPDGGWKLTFKDALTGGGDAMAGMDPSQMLPMFEGQLKSLSLGRKLTLPTKILETNGKASEDGLSVEWAVTYDRILEGKDLTMSVVFAAAEGLDLKPFTYAPDLMSLTRRFMEKPPAPAKPTTPPSPAEPEKDAPKDAPDAPKDDPDDGK